MNIQNIIKVAEMAKAKTTDKRWQNAISRAVEAVSNGAWIVTELHDGLLITSDSGETYRANGHCTCRAGELGQPCKHLALRRLIEIARELETDAAAPTPRADIIADIKAAWSRRFPGESLADELMRRFRRNQIEMLSVDFLTAIRAAIA